MTPHQIAAIENAAAKFRWQRGANPAPKKRGRKFQTPVEKIRDSKAITEIICRVLNDNGFLMSEVLDRRRARPEHCAALSEAYTAAKGAGYSLQKIGRTVGRDHTTIHHAIRRAAQ
jgi:chromosomal replication initiation ATPase DnaA